MTPRRSYWRAIADARRDFDQSELDVAKLSHGRGCECARCWHNRIADLTADMEPPVTCIPPEDRAT